MPPLAPPKSGNKPSTSPKKGSKAPVVPQREVVFSDIRICGVVIPPEKLKFTAAKAKDMMGWQTEVEYSEEQRKKDPKLKEDDKKCKLSENNVLLHDISGTPIACWNNSNNRPFDLNWCKELKQSILTQTYKFNGQAMTVSQTNIVTDGQHRACALILAVQEYYANHAYWSKYWPEEPWIESFVYTGGSDDPEVIRTQDYGKPRSLSDVCYTSPLFQTDNQGKPADKKYRAEGSRLLAKAIDLLWKRTGMSEWIPPGMESKKEDEKEAARENKERRFHHFQTHSESLEFRDRHPRLLDCVKFILDGNIGDKGRPLSPLKLSAGECSAVMYLMAFSGADRGKYLKGNPPSEAQMKFDKKRYDLASQFWAAFLAKSDTLEPVREAIKDLKDVETGADGRRSEKFAIICKAWNLFVQEEKVTKALVRLQVSDYGTTSNGVTYLKDQDTKFNFGGIDIGEKGMTAGGDNPAEETKVQQEAEAKRIRQEKAKAILDERLKGKAKGNGANPGIMDYEPPTATEEEEEENEDQESEDDDSEEGEDEENDE